MAAYRDQATVSGDAVRLGDVADLSALPAGLRGPAQSLTIAWFRPGQTEMIVRPERLAEKARSLMPALASRLPAGVTDPIRVRRSSEAPSSVPARTCLTARRDMSAGETPRRDDFETAPCGRDPVPPALRYDPALASARLTRDLRAGDSIATPPAFALAGVQAGQSMVLTIRVGPVTVERQVVAVRASGPGRPVFVQGDDRQVFSAPAPRDAP
jgi:hypothetical protein